MHQLVELLLVLDLQLLLNVHIARVSGNAHAHPVVFLLDHVVDPLDAHEETEHGPVALHRILVEDDLKWPLSLQQSQVQTLSTHDKE